MIEEGESRVSKIKTLLDEQNKSVEDLQRYSEELLKEGYLKNERSIIQKRVESLKEEIIDSKKAIEKLLLEIGKKKEDIEKELLKKPTSIKESENYYFQEGNTLKTKGGKTYRLGDLKAKRLEKETLRRLRTKKKDKEVRRSKKTKYSEVSSRIFSKLSKKLLGKESFKELEKNLIKANLDYAPTGYISMILFTTILAAIVGGFIFLFFLFFGIEATVPFIKRSVDSISIRFLKVFWILILAPLGTFIMMYLYPSMEKKSAEARINTELPFATIHMSAISGSMINPIKIFEIIVSTKEYPYLEKEFKKLLNEINVYGSDLVSALKNSARNTPSKKLSELLNGLATTINSGGDLPKFFEKRSENLMFEYRINREKATKAAETFMDIYISVVVAAPMILMLLLMMMKISGLGLGLSVSAITLMMILGVCVVNIIFLTFLHMKRSE
ncbi:MAG: type II secretion system F family protein [Nanoarchaeota archaeon]|nr:type II secretion system F family protein [Nanoarchaeota archaeon]